MQLGVEVPESGAAQPDTSLPFHLCAMSTGLPELNSEVVVEGEEGRHAVSVRRLRTGESVVLIDGTGAWVQGPVVGLEGRDRFTMVVRARGQAPPVQPRLVVVQALPKNERADEAIELLTAVGVDEIVAWHAERCIARWRGDRATRGLSRWRRAATAAAKQARRTTIPTISGPLSTTEVTNVLATSTLGLVCAGPGATPLARLPISPNGQVVIVVGPEGGCTDSELAHFTHAGAQQVALGPTVLRSVVAGTVAATLVLAGSGRWSGSGGNDGP